ncbi:MAG: ATP-grasp domain-containing protein [Clostridia bacterium]|nr:ATP-grasp domain-containing protein [Clostridia bacterium]
MLKNYSVAVLFGGVSSEHEVSVITGTLVCNVLINGGESVLPVYIDRSGNAYAGEGLADVGIYKGEGYKKFERCSLAQGGVHIFNKRGKPVRSVGAECVLNCCHGGVCEGGAVAGACALLNLPCASAGMFESSVFMDKYFTKLVLKSLGVPVAKYAYSRDIAGAIAGAKELGYPVIIKPATLGSSIGIAKCDNIEQLKSALELAFELDGGVLIEEYLSPRREINCAAYMREGSVICSPLEEATSAGAVLSYDDKYCGGGSRVFPAELDGQTAEIIHNLTEQVYTALNMRGIVRFDFIISGERILISEINTVPGSLSQYLLSDSYKNFYGVLKDVINQAKQDFAAHKQKRIITTGILNDIKPATPKLK